MPYKPPQMLPGQIPYTEAEYTILQLLLAAAIDDEESDGHPIGSQQWYDREIALDKANDARKRRGG